MPPGGTGFAFSCTGQRAHYLYSCVTSTILDNRLSSVYSMATWPGIPTREAGIPFGFYETTVSLAAAADPSMRYPRLPIYMTITGCAIIISLPRVGLFTDALIGIGLFCVAWWLHVNVVAIVLLLAAIGWGWLYAIVAPMTEEWINKMYESMRSMRRVMSAL
ncbi:predicted protein [Postia placenta Mad-698-R]|uniref:Uncharacterized protein n=1 Tax=Postia placenta MAD-698-R-SB12 TaxID=670580 RepID=A0A1X6N4J9_9APHY|nr:hypothetical protein POSPLADRAFT_1045774 [Postia placenta MAD-698-R-SB12]EED84502.1 predicted protein [Postia placenta Mad-698-R]OSX63450.1 hypothetical protein POSPLADRAFT_1045774 [Postia placenta MAD-698-R-SB12]